MNKVESQRGGPKRPKVLWVAFYKDGAGRCCSEESLKYLRQNHPADRYDAVAYVPRKGVRN